jgi:hypothetical protein
MITLLRGTHCHIARTTVFADFQYCEPTDSAPYGGYRTHEDFEAQYGVAFLVYQPAGQSTLQVAINETPDCDCDSCLESDELEFCDTFNGSPDEIKSYLLLEINRRVRASYASNQADEDPSVIISFH